MNKSSPETTVLKNSNSLLTQKIAAIGGYLQKANSCITWHYASIALIASFIALIPFRRAEIPMIIMALIGLGLIIKHRQTLWQRPEVKLFSLIFATIWVPTAVSLFGAVNFEKTLTVVIAFLRFYPVAIFVILTLSVPGAAERLLRICAWVLMIWVIDALLQAVTGYNSLGFPIPGDRVNSFFGTGIHFGVFMATLSPLLLVYARKHWPTLLQVAMLAGLIVVVFLAGSRNGWIGLAIVLLGMTIWSIRNEGVKMLSRLAVLCLLCAIVTAGTLHFSQSFSARVNTSLQVLSGETELIDVAISSRLPIWENALEMFKANPINGVGARNLRFAYADFASPDDFFIEQGLTVAHAHQLLLDIGSETGLVGLLGLVLTITLLARAWYRADSKVRPTMLPYALALLAVFFPLNSHYAIYSTAWSSTYFWLITLFCATTAIPAQSSSANSCFANRQINNRKGL